MQLNTSLLKWTLVLLESMAEMTPKKATQQRTGIVYNQSKYQNQASKKLRRTNALKDGGFLVTLAINLEGVLI